MSDAVLDGFRRAALRASTAENKSLNDRAAKHAVAKKEQAAKGKGIKFK